MCGHIAGCCSPVGCKRRLETGAVVRCQRRALAPREARARSSISAPRARRAPGTACPVAAPRQTITEAAPRGTKCLRRFSRMASLAAARALLPACRPCLPRRRRCATDRRAWHLVRPYTIAPDRLNAHICSLGRAGTAEGHVLGVRPFREVGHLARRLRRGAALLRPIAARFGAVSHPTPRPVVGCWMLAAQVAARGWVGAWHALRGCTPFERCSVRAAAPARVVPRAARGAHGRDHTALWATRWRGGREGAPWGAFGSPAEELFERFLVPAGTEAHLSPGAPQAPS